MKLPPRPELHARAQVLADERDARFLVFIGAVLVLLTLGFKSELVAPSEVWWLALGLVLVTAPALFAYLHGRERSVRVEHFVPLAIGAIVVAGLSLLITQWWQFAIASAGFGLAFLVSAELDYRKLKDQTEPWHGVVQDLLLAAPLAGAFLVVVAAPFPLALRTFWLAALGLVAAYRSFRIHDPPFTAQRAWLIAFFVGQVIGLAAWAISVYLSLQEGPLAVLLLLIWYINRGIFRHVFEDSLTKQVMLEYGAFGALAAYIFFISYHPS